MALASMTGDRFVLGLGTSTPQIMEAWDGVAFDRPIRRTRELIEIIRLVESGERVVHDGAIHRIPLRDELRPMRTRAGERRLPIYIASVGPQNLRLTGELADGWIGNCFVPETSAAFFDPLRAGAEGAERSLEDLELQVPVTARVRRRPRRARQGATPSVMRSRSARWASPAATSTSRPSRGRVSRKCARFTASGVDGRRGEAQDLVPVELARKSNLLGTGRDREGAATRIPGRGRGLAAPWVCAARTSTSSSRTSGGSWTSSPRSTRSPSRRRGAGSRSASGTLSGARV